MSSTQTSEVCPVLRELPEDDALGIARHAIQFCFHCLRKRLQDRFNGKEVLYPNGPPPWIGTDLKMAILKEDVDEHLYKRSFELSDSHLTYEIMKLKGLKRSEAHKVMIELRQRVRAERNELLKKPDGTLQRINARRLLPWIPTAQSLFPRGVLSVLSQTEQIRFLAICQNILNLCPLRFTHNLKEIKRRWQKRWDDETSEIDFDFDDVVSSIEWSILSSRSDSEMRPELVTTLLKGRGDRIQLPNLRNRCLLDSYRLYTEFPIWRCNENRIFNDLENLTTLCLENGVRIAMDATTACHLMCDPFVGHNYSYVIPIRVVQKVKKGILADIAVLDKPRVLNTVDCTTIQRQFLKYLLKTTFVHKRSESPLKYHVKGPSPNTESAGKDQSGFCAPLDSILPSLDHPPIQATSDLSKQSENHKTYSIFSVMGSNILVRSRPPPLCSEGRPPLKGSTLSFQPRAEYVPNAGAMCLSEEESMWNYCKGIFKQSAYHGLFRTHYSEKHVLQMQFWETQSFAIDTGSEQMWTGPTSKQDAKQIIANRTFRFSRLLEAIGRLPHGDYMLVNRNDGFIRILNQAGNRTNPDAVLKCSDRKIFVCKPKTLFCDAFNGLEPVVPLMWQLVQGRAPGCYVAPDSKLKLIAQTPLPESSILADNFLVNLVVVVLSHDFKFVTSEGAEYGFNTEDVMMCFRTKNEPNGIMVMGLTQNCYVFYGIMPDVHNLSDYRILDLKSDSATACREKQVFLVRAFGDEQTMIILVDRFGKKVRVQSAFRFYDLRIHARRSYITLYLEFLSQPDLQLILPRMDLKIVQNRTSLVDSSLVVLQQGGSFLSTPLKNIVFKSNENVRPVLGINRLSLDIFDRSVALACAAVRPVLSFGNVNKTAEEWVLDISTRRWVNPMNAHRKVLFVLYEALS
uniref:Ankyrin repeat and fibronectin type-III domain-containing protein 1 n=1 Tax=Angiostrongylus cantonensis TaxID=6313 RepID=A0A158P9C3_ANGCA